MLLLTNAVLAHIKTIPSSTSQEKNGAEEDLGSIQRLADVSITILESLAVELVYFQEDTTYEERSTVFTFLQVPLKMPVFIPSQRLLMESTMTSQLMR